MTTPTFNLPTSGSDPKRATKEGLEENINSIIQYLDDARIVGDDRGTEGFYNAGPWDASTGVFPIVRKLGGSVQNGDTFFVQDGGAGVVDGQPQFEVGQRIIALVDNPSSTTYAGNWERANTIAILEPLTSRVDAMSVPFDTVADFFAASLADIKALANATTGTAYVEIKKGGYRYSVDLSQTTTDFTITTTAGVVVSIADEVPTPYHFGGIGGGTVDDTDALNDFFVYFCANIEKHTACDWTGVWGVTDTITIDQQDALPRSYYCGEIKYIGVGDLDVLLSLKDVRSSKFTNRIILTGGGGIDYTTRTVTDLCIATLSGEATFDGFKGTYAKRHGLDTGGLRGETFSHIGMDCGRCYFKECGSAIIDNLGYTNIRLKEYSFSGLIESGSATSTTQTATATISGGTDVLQVGGIFKFGDHYHYIDEVDEGAGTITFFPWLHTTATSGTFKSCHGAAVRCWLSNGASMRIGGLKVLGCGVGLDNESLYGPYVSNLETQVTGVSYKQKGLCYGTVIDGFHPETPPNDVDVLKCDGFESRTTITGWSVYRGEDIINLWPTDSATGVESAKSMIGVQINPDSLPLYAGQRGGAAERNTSITVRNNGDAGAVPVRNRTTSTVSLERDKDIARLFGQTEVRIIRLGDFLNPVAGSTQFQPTTADASDGVTVMGGATYSVAALPEGSIIVCDLDVMRDDWRVSVFPNVGQQTATTKPTGGATVDAEARTAIDDLIDKLTDAGILQ